MIILLVIVYCAWIYFLIRANRDQYKKRVEFHKEYMDSFYSIKLYDSAKHEGFYGSSTSGVGIYGISTNVDLIKFNSHE